MGGSSDDKDLPSSEVNVAERMSGREIYWRRSDCPDENRSCLRTDSDGAIEGRSGDNGRGGKLRSVAERGDSAEIRGGFIGLMREGRWGHMDHVSDC